MSNKSFEGFKHGSVKFLSELKKNNNKPWFIANKGRYEEFVLNPFKSLVADLSDFMLKIDPFLNTIPAVSKTISRIYRDTRFSKSKLPFRSNVWISFKRPGIDWKDRPTWYFELTPDSYGYGMGYYSASTETIRRFHEKILSNRNKFIKTAENIKHFELDGKKYKRPKSNDRSNVIREWMGYRNFYLYVNKGHDPILYGRKLPEHIRNSFSELKPLYDFLRSLY